MGARTRSRLRPIFLAGSLTGRASAKTEREIERERERTGARERRCRDGNEQTPPCEGGQATREDGEAGKPSTGARREQRAGARNKSAPR